MRESVTPEILSQPLDTIYLYHCGLLQSDPLQFEWLTPPNAKDSASAISEIQNKKLVTARFHLSELGSHILSIPLDLDSAFLFHFLCVSGLSEIASDYFARGEDLPKKRQALPLGEDDIDFIFNLPLGYIQKQKRQQLLDGARKITSQSSGPQNTRQRFRETLAELHFKFLKNRVLSQQQKFSRSSTGSGALLDQNSGAQKENFFIALQGYESETLSVQITYALGIKKIDFLKWAEGKIVEDLQLEFDSDKQTFYKRKLKLFGAIVVNEESKQTVPLHEIQDHWIRFLDQNFDVLMKDNSSYQRLLEKFNFISRQQQSHPDLFEFAAFDQTAWAYFARRQNLWWSG